MIARACACAVLLLAALAVDVDAQAPDGAGSQPVDSSRRGSSLEDVGASAPYSREIWLHAHRQEPIGGVPAFGVIAEGLYLFGDRAHDRWRRNTSAEVLAQPLSWIRAEIGYDPESARITGAGGFHLFAEGSMAFATRLGAGGYARYDRAGSTGAALVSDVEAGGQFSFWSDERRVFFNEKVGLRRVAANDGTGVESGDFFQLRQHVVYIPSEDWGLTFVQEATVNLGIGEGPHTNELRVENLFLVSPSLMFSAGPIVGVGLRYLVGPATTALAVPVGARAEAYLGAVAITATAIFDVPTIEGQSTPGLLLRGSAGLRF
jgi:hypothetical protein